MILIAGSRIDQVDAEGSGTLARITFNIAADFAKDSLVVDVFSNGGVQATGDEVEFDNGSIVGIREIATEDAFEVRSMNVYPNPTSGSVRFNLPLNESFQVEVTNIMGQVVITEINVQGGLVNVSLSDLAAGMYTMKVKGADVLYTSKIQVAK